MKNLIVLFCGLLLAACSSYSSTTKGYQLDDNVFRVEMRGTADNDVNDATEYALLKAAELTIDNGAKYFTVESTMDRAKKGAIVLPGSSQSNTTTTANATLYGNSAWGNASSTTYGTYTPAQTLNFVRPGVDVIIKTYASEPGGSFFDASKVTKYIGPRLNPERWGKPKEK